MEPVQAAWSLMSTLADIIDARMQVGGQHVLAPSVVILTHPHTHSFFLNVSRQTHRSTAC